MMKIKTTIDGRPTVILGLSHANLNRLRVDGLAGHVKVDGVELEIPFDILITAAETEQVMLDAFEAGIRAGTKLRIDPRLKS